MGNMLLVDEQKATEYRYDKKRVASLIRRNIDSKPELVTKINHCISLLTSEYILTNYSYTSKNVRVGQLLDMDMEEAIYRILEVVMLLDRSITLSNLVGQTSSVLNYEDKLDNIKSISEIIVYVAKAGLLNLFPASMTQSGMIEVEPIYLCDEKVFEYVKQTKYLPPIICTPNKLKKNSDSAYLTVKNDSLILKSGNHHNGDICLDSLNLFNSIEFSLDIDFLKVYDEEPTYLLDTDEKKAQFDKMREDSYEIYLYLIQQGNTFHLGHKYDKRGRTYCEGYHCSYQGNKFRKAIMEFAEQEVVEGF